MQNNHKIISIIHKLSKANNNDFKTLLEYYIQKLIVLISEIREIKEVLQDYIGIYQICFADRDLEFYFQINQENIIYQNGVYEDYSIKFVITKDLLLKIFKMEIQTYDAYMRGFIKAEGDLSYLIRFKNFLNDCTKYLSKYFSEYEMNIGKENSLLQ